MNIKKEDYKIAYFSMEIALESKIKTYSGGLGVLAGDILKSASDLRIPMVGVTLVSRYGYFKQKIDKNGKQKEYLSKDYDFSKLKKIKKTTYIKIGKDKVFIRAWQYIIKNTNGLEIPVYLLDTNLPKNKKEYRNLTDQLYGGDKHYRLLQETVLGRGGYALIKKLGYKIEKFHMNEGHGSFVAISKFLDSKSGSKKAIEETREACVFTTHTPVKMAHDVFPLEEVLKYQPDFPHKLKGLISDKQVNMTKIGLHFSNYINGVALSHQEVSKRMFPGYLIHSITNGVHSQTWTSPEFKKLFDKYIPNWRISSLSLRNAFSIPLDDIWSTHQKEKRKLITLVKKKTGIIFDEKVFTIGFARRFTTYKRATLLFNDIERLLSVQKKAGKMQIIYAGKAHPRDGEGKKLLAEINRIGREYKKEIKVVFIEDYDVNLAKKIIPGVDLWLNTPLPPNEASGTSGMKAAHNGVPQLSSYDGWWREGYIRNKTGWSIKHDNKKRSKEERDKLDANQIYNLLEKEILPKYYNDFYTWKKIMRFCIGVNASFFNTERVLREYVENAYL